MKIIIQRVKEASVAIEKNLPQKIGKGMVLLVGFEKGDTSVPSGRNSFAARLPVRTNTLRIPPSATSSKLGKIRLPTISTYELVVVTMH